MTTATLSKGQKQAADISALLRARNPLIWIVTREEARVEGFIAEAASSAGYKPYFWDIAAGVTKLDGTRADFGGEDPGETLKSIRDRAEGGLRERAVIVMRDLPKLLEGPIGITTLRQLRNLSRFLPGVARDKAQAVIILTTSGEVPADLAGQTTVIEWSLPDRAEIAAVLDATLSSLNDEMRAAAASDSVRDLAIDAAVGLTGEEAASCYARSLVQTKKIDPAIISNEKRRVIARERVLEWIDPIKGGLDAVGGLENMKTWLNARKSAYSQKAREYGLPSPKGAVLVGVSGCGKSLSAKATATAWGVPLLKLDLGALKGKFVGDSEGNIRKAFRVIEAIGRCVVWIDEIEKAMAGATDGAADGGVSKDALGVVLNWMQERTSEAFVIATANDIENLPPELLRKGRFDEIWFVDTPNQDERIAVLKTALKSHGREDIKVDVKAIAHACDTFTGAEIAEIVPTAMYAAFAEDAREITTDDLLAAAGDVVPLTKTAEGKITKLREWAATKARKATAPTRAKTATNTRKLDFDDDIDPTS